METENLPNRQKKHAFSPSVSAGLYCSHLNLRVKQASCKNKNKNVIHIKMASTVFENVTSRLEFVIVLHQPHTQEPRDYRELYRVPQYRGYLS